MAQETKKRAQLFSQWAEAWLNQNKEQSKFNFALSKIRKKIKSQVEDYQDESSEHRITLASVDDKKNVLIDAQGNFSFTPENHKTLLSKVKEIGKQTIEFEPHFVNQNDIPESLPYSYREAFEGFVIKEQESEEPQS